MGTGLYGADQRAAPAELLLEQEQGHIGVCGASQVAASQAQAVVPRPYLHDEGKGAHIGFFAEDQQVFKCCHQIDFLVLQEIY